MGPEIDRRRFLGLGMAAAGGLTMGGAGLSSLLPAGAQAGTSPYGPLREPDQLGLRLPDGFTSRLVATSGAAIGRSGYRWHPRPDGGATFTTPDGGWIYVSNSEVENGSAGAVRFDRSGAIVDAYSILHGTRVNCAGGATPWGTWLSCEEVDHGGVWECDPTGQRPAVERPALGNFKHEAACVDPRRERLYLTEDEDDGRLYRFTSSAWPSLDRGKLEVAVVGGDGIVEWRELPDRNGRPKRTRTQIRESTRFNRGEGIWYDDGRVYFVTTGDGKVWMYDVDDRRMTVLYDPDDFDDPPLVAPDNITVTPAGEALVAEDIDDDQELVLVSGDGVASPLVRLTGQEGSEITGPAFDPSGTRLYFSSQLGPDGESEGTTYEITGPFRPRASLPTSTTVPRAVTSLRARETAAPRDDGGGDGGGGAAPTLALGGAGLALVVGAGLGWRLRSRASSTR
jgi:secreted PhoX family phosphatase